MHPGTPLRHNGVDWPAPKADGEPLPIEIVRGALGPTDDRWVVIVDGVRCTPSLSTEDGQQILTCTLPPPIALNAPLNLESVVRPVVMAARLENEALEPIRIDITTRQVVNSSERSSSTPGGDRESLEINRKTIKAYRPRSTSASSAVLPYPFHAPSQSSLALVSYREVQKWEEQQVINKAHNDNVDVKFKTDQAAHADKRSVYAKDAEEYGLKWASNKLLKDGYDLEQQRYATQYAAWQAVPRIQRGVAPRKPKKPAYEKNPKPQKPTEPKRGKYRGLSPKPNKDDAQASFVIGNNAHSAPWCLAKMFKTLGLACDALREGGVDEGGGRGAGLRALLDAMRALLSDSGNRSEQALLEALLTAIPYDMTALVTESNDVAEFIRQFEVTEETAGADGQPTQYSISSYDATSARGKKRSQDRMNAIQTNMEKDGEKMRAQRRPDEKATRSPYQFVYERLPIEARSATTLLLQYQFEVIEHNSDKPLIIRFEAEQYYGIVAHAVYAGYHRDVDMLDKAAQEFVRCMFDLKTNRTMASRATDLAGDAKELLGNVVAFLPEGYGFGALPEGNDDTPLQWLYKVTFGSFASWLNKKSENFDPRQIELISNELRVMSRLILPVWPPLPESDPPRDPSGATAAENAGAGAVLDRGEAPEPSDPSVNLKPYPPNKILYEGEEAWDVEAPGPFRPDSPTDEEPPPLSIGAGVGATGFAEVSALEAYRLDETRPQRIVRRDLPQIVLPSHAKLPAFATPNDTTLPDEHQKQPRQRSWFMPALFIVSAGVWMYFFHYLQLAYFYMAVIPLAAQTLGKKFQKVVDSMQNLAGAGALLLQGRVWSAAASVWGAGADLAEFEVAKLGWVVGVNQFYIESHLKAMGPAYIIATRTWEFARWINQPNNVRGDIYWRTLQKARGTPIISALGAARGAIVAMRQDERSKKTALRTLEGSRVVFNSITMKRFTFYERYLLDDLDDPLRIGDEGVVALHTDDEWSRVPDGTTLTLLPPADVSEALYEAEILRDIPIARAVARSVGAAPGLVATTPAQIAAKAAHHELMQVVRGARVPLQGAHLMESPASTSLQLAIEGAALLHSAYGVSAGVTLVPGDDPVWTCLPAGVAARTALRHSPVFSRANQQRKDNQLKAASQQYIEQLQSWRTPQRALVDAFAKAWVDEARDEARGRSDANPNLMNNAINATRSFVRTKALASDETKSVVGLLVASSYSVLLNAFRTDGAKGQLAGIVASERAAAEAFSDQRDFLLPNRVVNPKLVAPAWASRRLDLNWAREVRLAQEDGSVNDLVGKLAALDVDEGDNYSGTRVYYCPMGSSLDALPGKTPFAIDQLGARPVWLELLGANAMQVSRVLAPTASVGQPTDAEVTISARLLSGLGEPDELSGLARHPLTVSATGFVVNVALSRTPSAGDMSTLPEAPEDIVRALLALLDGVLTSSIEKHVARLRSLAFNTDRLLNAAALATQQPGKVPTTIVRLPTPESVLALALALTVYKASSGGSPPGLVVLVDDVESAQRLLLLAQEAAARGLSAGCKVCPLAELAAVLA